MNKQRRLEPDQHVLSELARFRSEDLLLHGDGGKSGALAITLDLDAEAHAIEEVWANAVPDKEMTWLAAYAAVTSVLQFAAHVPCWEQRETIRRLAAGNAWEVSEWDRSDDIDWADVRFEIEILGTAHGNAASAYLLTNVPDGLNVGEVGEPIALLREYLVRHPDPRVAIACSAAYEALAETTDPLIGHIEDSARTDAQIVVPRSILRVLKREGLVAGPFTHSPEGGVS